MFIQALVPESAIKAFDLGVLRWFARLDKGELHTLACGHASNVRLECWTIVSADYVSAIEGTAILGFL
jgi:hypothetical protein